MAGRKLPEDFTARDEWQRRESEREAARHPRREKVVRWAAIAIIAALGLAAVSYMVLYFFLWAP